MESDCYSWRSNMGEVLIARNEERPSRWDLWISGKRVCPAYYKSPDDAAFFASRSDFGDEELNEKYEQLRVPNDLQQWRVCKLSGA